MRPFVSFEEIIVNCFNSKSSLDYEKLGSDLYTFLENNKIEKSFFDASTSYLTSVQLEKFLHGAQLKSYEFNVYKTDKSKNQLTNLYVVGNKTETQNPLPDSDPLPAHAPAKPNLYKGVPQDGSAH